MFFVKWLLWLGVSKVLWSVALCSARTDAASFHPQRLRQRELQRMQNMSGGAVNFT